MKWWVPFSRTMICVNCTCKYSQWFAYLRSHCLLQVWTEWNQIQLQFMPCISKMVLYKHACMIYLHYITNTHHFSCLDYTTSVAQHILLQQMLCSLPYLSFSPCSVGPLLKYAHMHASYSFSGFDNIHITILPKHRPTEHKYIPQNY